MKLRIATVVILVNALLLWVADGSSAMEAAIAEKRDTLLQYQHLGLIQITYFRRLMVDQMFAYRFEILSNRMSVPKGTVVRVMLFEWHPEKNDFTAWTREQRPDGTVLRRYWDRSK